MELISDILLIAGALGAAFYCVVLSRRLSRFTNLEKGMGGAIAVLSAQVDDMTKLLSQARGTATGSTSTLAALTERAEEVARRLELLVASMHDLPDADPSSNVLKFGSNAPRPPESGHSDSESGNVRQDGTASSDPPRGTDADGNPDLFRSSRKGTWEAAE